MYEHISICIYIYNIYIDMAVSRLFLHAELSPSVPVCPSLAWPGQATPGQAKTEKDVSWSILLIKKIGNCTNYLVYKRS